MESARLLEEYRLLNNNEMQVTYSLQSINIPSLVVTRIFKRIQSKRPPALPIPFAGTEVVNNWNQMRSHNVSTLRDIRVIVAIDSTSSEDLMKYQLKVYRIDHLL
jgi:hypothetical protein